MKDAILAQISTLSSDDKTRLHKLIERFLFDNEVDISSEQNKVKVSTANDCPHCASKRSRKNGLINGIQRFICNDCKKHFRVSTGSTTYYLKKRELLKVYIPHFLSGYSLEKCAKLTGICKQTSFNWRHKILSSLGRFTPAKLSGEVESDELEISISKKGSKILDRQPRKRGSDFKRNTEEAVTVIQVVTAVERGGEIFLKVTA